MAILLENGPAAGTIDSFDELIRAIDRAPNAAGYTDALMRFAMAPEALAPFCEWNTRHYTRHCLHRTRRHELLLICYEPGQRTSIHDYDSQTAWIKVLVGPVSEERFTAAADGSVRRRDQRLLLPGELSHMDNASIVHRHSNAGQGRAITLNLYARPISRWRVYDERTGRASVSGTGDDVRE